MKKAKFEILDNNKKIIRIAETNENGQMILSSLMPGTYYIREVNAPEGYVLDMKLHKIDISMNEKITLRVYNNKIIVINKEEDTEEPKKEEIPVEEVVPNIEIPKLPVTGM